MDHSIRKLVVINILVYLIPFVLIAFIIALVLLTTPGHNFSGDGAIFIIIVPGFLFIVPYIAGIATVINLVYALSFIGQGYPRKLFIISSVLTVLSLLICLAVSNFYLRTFGH